MADKLRITRGLYLPDPNFVFLPAYNSPGSYWRVTSGFPVSKILADDQSGAGHAIRVNVTAMGGTDLMASDYTPYGVGAGPNVTTTQYFKIYMLARTVGMTGGANLISVILRGYKADGVTPGGTSSTAYLVASPPYADWTVMECHVSLSPDTQCRWYQLQLAFTDGSGGTTRYIDIQKVLLGVPLVYDGTYKDEMATWYDTSPMQRLQGRTYWVSAADTVNPRAYSIGPAWLRSSITLSMPRLSEADARHLLQVHAWCAGTATQDMTADGANITSRGSRQPALIVLNRPVMNKAFYADISNLDLQQNTGEGQWFPDSGTLWRATLNLEEWA